MICCSPYSHSNGDDHTRLQTDNASTPTIPMRYRSTTNGTPANQFKLESYVTITVRTDLTARLAIPIRAAADPTAVNKHSPHMIWPQGVRVALVGEAKQIGHA